MSHASKDLYQNVFEQVCQIYESTVLKAELQQGHKEVTSYLQMGNRMDTLLTQAKENGT